jgi:hypothetical protein
MYELLIKLIFLSALMEIGWSVADVERCHSRHCLAAFENKSRTILGIRWKPISVFPQEGRRFRAGRISVPDPIPRTTFLPLM